MVRRCGSRWAAALLLGLTGCAASGGAAPGPAPEAAVRALAAVRAAAWSAGTAQTQPAALASALQPHDRVLFLGDEMTQQMFYTRSVAAALLALHPDWDLRFYNGGMDGATAGSAAAWADDLLTLTGPQVVFLCLGLNDGYQQPPTPALVAEYRRNLARLIEKVQAHPGVRRVIVLGPPAIQPPLQMVTSSRPQRDASNPAYQVLSRAACAEAAAHHMDGCDLYAITDVVNTEAGKLGVPLSLGGNLPGEIGHMVLAGVILSALGVHGPQLDAVGWPPISPRRIGAIRWTLAPGMAPMADLDRLPGSLDLYDDLRAFDEVFFQAWRLAGKSPSAPRRDNLLAVGAQVWGRVQKQARVVAGLDQP